MMDGAAAGSDDGRLAACEPPAAPNSSAALPHQCLRNAQASIHFIAHCDA
jgi:hypothetical protein